MQVNSTMEDRHNGTVPQAGTKALVDAGVEVLWCEGGAWLDGRDLAAETQWGFRAEEQVARDLAAKIAAAVAPRETILYVSVADPDYDEETDDGYTDFTFTPPTLTVVQTPEETP